MPQMNKAMLDDVNMYLVGFRITRILTDYAQKLRGHWLCCIVDPEERLSILAARWASGNEAGDPL